MNLNYIKYISLLVIIGLSLGLIVNIANASIFDWVSNLFFNQTEEPLLGAPTQTFQKDLFPITDNTYNLGSSTRQWLGLAAQNASTTAFSIPTTGYFNLNATGTMQGFSLCTSGNGICASNLTGTTGQIAYFSGTNTAIGTSTLFISTAGNVGIGMTSPSKMLHISNAAGAAALELTDTRTNGADLIISTSDFGLSKTILYTTGSNENQDLAFGTNSLERVTIKNSGNVGIGTTTPNEKFDIRGHIKIEGNLPVVDSCGEPNTLVSGSDSAGIITTGDELASNCHLQFMTLFKTNPVCTANNAAGSAISIALTATPGGVLFTFSTQLLNDKIGYICVGL